ncbi:2-keto-4-pentenoate hydratase [Actinomycetes bacterium NPDC127524]
MEHRDEIVQVLLDAETGRKEINRITAKYPDLLVEEAYEIQSALVHRKLASGSVIVGPKMGLTSEAKMKQMNVNEPIYGYIFDYMKISNGGNISMSELIHPKVEAELAFILKQDLGGDNLSIDDVLQATQYIAPALEIIDSRYKDFKFTLPDVIADNTSASRVVFGDRITIPTEIEVDSVGVTISFNGKANTYGTSSAVLGHPASSIAMLAEMLHRKGQKLRAGEIVLSGAITEAVLFKEGDYVSVKFDGLGEVSFNAVV